MPIPNSITINDPNALRDWMRQHTVEGFSAERDPRVLEGRTADGRASFANVPAAVWQQINGEVVWMHHPKGKRLPPGTLLGLHEQLAPTAS